MRKRKSSKPTKRVPYPRVLGEAEDGSSVRVELCVTVYPARVGEQVWVRVQLPNGRESEPLLLPPTTPCRKAGL